MGNVTLVAPVTAIIQLGDFSKAAKPHFIRYLGAVYKISS